MTRYLDPAAAGPFLLGALGALVITALVYQIRILKLRLQFQREIKEAARRSVEQSRNTLKGQIGEQMVSVLPGFCYLPADARFLGDPIDYIVFNGRNNLDNNETSAEDVEVVLLEVKHGQSKLTPVQRAIAAAVDAGRVRFEIAQISEDGIVTIGPVKSSRRGRE